KTFQSKKELKVDGIVYTKTWTALLNSPPEGVHLHKNIYLQKSDILQLAEKLQVEPAVIQAVKSVESKGHGFLEDGRPRILFEGHIFWRQLKQRGYFPKNMRSG